MAIKSLPVGTIIAWENATIPDNWAVCNGANGTPDLRSKFIRGASVDGDVGTTGGASSHTHTNPSTSERASHNHGASVSVSTGSNTGSRAVQSGSGVNTCARSHGHSDLSGDVSSANAHSHSVGDTDSGGELPPHIRRVFIQKVE